MQHIRRRHDPVGDVVAENATRSAANLRIQFRVPPYVEDVHDDADLIGWKFFSEIVRLFQRIDDRPLRRIHRMQRLDAEFDAALFSKWRDLSDPFLDHLPCRSDIFVRRRPAYEHKHVGA